MHFKKLPFVTIGHGTGEFLCLFPCDLRIFGNNIGYTVIGFGIVGFILTLVYVIYNGVVYTNYYNSSSIYKVDGDGAFAEYDQKKGGYECFYYKKDDYLAIYAKFCDLIKSQYNYDYDLTKSFINDPAKSGSGCQRAEPTDCLLNDYIFYKSKEI